MPFGVAALEGTDVDDHGGLFLQRLFDIGGADRSELAVLDPIGETRRVDADIGIAFGFRLERRLMAERALQTAAIEDQQLRFVLGQFARKLIELAVGNADGNGDMALVIAPLHGAGIDNHDIVPDGNRRIGLNEGEIDDLRILLEVGA